VSSTECVNTFDAHEDKVWALAANKDGSQMLSGGGDGRVSLWKDCTVADDLKKAEDVAKEIEQTQQLSNLMNTGQMNKAMRMAIELRRPGMLLKVIDRIIGGSSEHTKSLSTMLSVVGMLDVDSLSTLLEFCRGWNANSRFCFQAQHVIHAVVRVWSPEALAKVPGISELLEALIPYTRRHMNRLERFQRSSFLIDYTLSSMGVLQGDSTVAQPLLKAEPASTVIAKLSKRALKRQRGSRTAREEATKRARANDDLPNGCETETLAGRIYSGRTQSNGSSEGPEASPLDMEANGQAEIEPSKAAEAKGNEAIESDEAAPGPASTEVLEVPSQKHPRRQETLQGRTSATKHRPEPRKTATPRRQSRGKLYLSASNSGLPTASQVSPFKHFHQYSDLAKLSPALLKRKPRRSAEQAKERH